MPAQAANSTRSSKREEVSGLGVWTPSARTAGFETCHTLPRESRGIPGPGFSRAKRRSSFENALRLSEVTDARIRHRKIESSKRALDLALGTLAFIVFAPLLIVAAALVRTTSPGPALFRQTRIGRDGRPFTMYKLRTMRHGCDDQAHREFSLRELLENTDPGTRDGIYKLQDDRRITKVGRLLRRFSIDELPQLFNVLRGDMSLVGPRPSLPWEAGLYTPRQQLRHQVRPGMTGLWQVSGRNRISIPEMLALDLKYVEEYSLMKDIWILLRTPRAVLFDQTVR